MHRYVVFLIPLMQRTARRQMRQDYAKFIKLHFACSGAPL
jgi:hypothetical protein